MQPRSAQGMVYAMMRVHASAPMVIGVKAATQNVLAELQTRAVVMVLAMIEMVLVPVMPAMPQIYVPRNVMEALAMLAMPMGDA